MRLTLTLVALTSLIAPSVTAQPCNMALDFRQPDRNGATTVPVWRDANSGALLFADRMNINTDGTRRSYSVDDFWGETRALNNLCNAMSDGCRGLNSSQLRERRILTQRAKALGWPPGLLAQTRISSSILPFRQGRPCAEVDGYLVSATALFDPAVRDECDIRRYADALLLNAVVIPKRLRPGEQSRFEQRGAKVGDLAVAMSANGRILANAVVGDMGPSKELGEVSIALAQRLNGRRSPANYNEIRGRGEFAGRGWSVDRTFILIFPRTRNSSIPFMTQDRVDTEAAKLFSAWGGADRLMRCAARYDGR